MIYLVKYLIQSPKPLSSQTIEVTERCVQSNTHILSVHIDRIFPILSMFGPSNSKTTDNLLPPPSSLPNVLAGTLTDTLNSGHFARLYNRFPQNHTHNMEVLSAAKQIF